MPGTAGKSAPNYDQICQIITRDGYEHKEAGTTCTFPEGSDGWLFWHFGRWMRRTGRDLPRNIERAPNGAIRADDADFAWTGETDIGGPVFTRAN